MTTALTNLANVLTQGYAPEVERNFTRLVDTPGTQVISFTQLLQSIQGAIEFGSYDNTGGNGGDKAGRWLAKYGTGNTVTAYGPSDRRPSSGTGSTWRQAELDWRSIWVSIGLTGKALRAAMAQQRWDNISTWEQHMEDGLDDLFDELDRMLVLADGTGQSNKEFHGLAYFLVQTGTVYNINMGTYTWHKPAYKDLSNVEPTVDDFENIWEQCLTRGWEPDHILCSPFRARKLRDLRVSAERNPTDLRPNQLSFNGVPITPINRFPNDKIFFGRRKHHKLRIQRWPMDPTGLQSSTNHRGMPFGLIPNDDGGDGVGLTLALEGNYLYKNLYECAFMENAPTS